MPFLTGDTGGLSECRQFLLPQDDLLFYAVMGQIAELTFPENWEQFGLLSPDEAAAIMQDMFDGVGECVGVGFGSGVVTDNFNRADENPSTGYTVFVGSNQVLNYQLRGFQSGLNLMFSPAADIGPDLEVYCTITDLSSVGSAVVLFARVQGPASFQFSGYLVTASLAGVDPGAVIQRVDNNVTTNLHSPVLFQPYPGDKLGIQIIGDEISLQYDSGLGWTELASVTDATYSAAGRTGIGLQEPGSAIDNYSIREII